MALSAAEREKWLSEDNSRVVIADIQYNDTLSNKILRVSDFPYAMIRGDSTIDPIDDVTSLSNLQYDDIINTVPNIISRIDTESSLGSIVLYNTDGEYDSYLNDFTLVGHPVKIYIGQSNWVRDNFIIILDGIISKVSAPNLSSIRIDIKDRKGILDIPIQTQIVDNAYWDALMTKVDDSISIFDPIIGTPDRAYDKSLAVLPESTENTQVPICLGKCFNIEPLLVDSFNQVYLLHDSDEGIISVDEVRANGVTLGSSQYEVDITLGIIRLLDNSQGTQLTCDVVGQNGRSDIVPVGSLPVTLHSAAGILEWILLEKGNILFTELSQDTFPPSAPNGFDNESEMGFYTKSDVTILSVVTNLINSVGGFIRFRNEDSILSLYKLIDPSLETPDLIIVADDIVERGISVKAIEEPKRSITLGYKKNWKTQDGSLALSITDIDSPVYSLETLDSFLNDYTKLYELSGISATQFPLAEDIELIETTIFNTVDAQTELDRRIILRSVRRRVIKLDTLASSFTYGIGDIVSITHPRYGFESGKIGIIIGIEESPTDKRVNLDVWL